MGYEAREIKPRTCRTCKETIKTTATGIKEHFEQCKEKPAEDE